MSEYCEYMWDPSRGRSNAPALARSIYTDDAKLDAKDRKLAIKTVRAILRGMPDVDLNRCTDEYVTRFLLARKYRTEQAAALIAAYQSQIAHRRDIFGNLTARDPPLQRALRAGIPGVLPARDRKGRCVLVILASQWDPVAVPALSVQRAIFLVLETLIQDPRNQQCGFVAVVDWSGFSLRQGGALGAAAPRNLIAALRGRFPARFKAVHFLSAPLCVQATLALVKPFLDEKTRRKIYLHGNNLSTLHEHLPTDILPAELGGTGPAFDPGLWAEPVIHSAMKEAESAAIERERRAAESTSSRNDQSRETTRIENRRNAGNAFRANPEERTPGNGRAAGTDREEEKRGKAEESRARSVLGRNEETSSDSRRSERPDGRESRVSSKNAKSPLIDANPREEAENRSNSRNDSAEETNEEKNPRASRVGERVGLSSGNDENRRDVDERTRLRVYRDAVDARDEKSTGGRPKNAKITPAEEIETIDGLRSETNSNEYEMIPSRPESDESRENSMETLRVDEAAITKSGNEPLSETVDLIA